MKINEKRMEEFLKEKQIKAPTCPLCGKDSWTFVNKIYHLRELEQTKANEKINVMPVIALCCDNCGNTYFINAVLNRLVDKDNEDEVNSDATKKV